MLGKGVLATWNDCALGNEPKYENWDQNGHLPERLSVHGFIRDLRYQILLETPAFSPVMRSIPRTYLILNSIKGT